jgi:hypothetical protein
MESTTNLESTVFFCESGQGERLSEPGGEHEARSLVRNRRERLICRVTGPGGDLESEDLVYDYAAHPNGPDDTGEEFCDECGAWTVELVSSAHATSCSLHPKNIH